MARQAISVLWLGFHSLIITFSYTIQDNFLSNGITHSDLGSPTSEVNLENPHQLEYGHSDGGSPSVKYPFSHIILACVTVTKPNR